MNQQSNEPKINILSTTDKTFLDLFLNVFPQMDTNLNFT